jgi:hypothetical protein
LPWSTPFDDPIVLEDGTTLRTLRDAIKYLGKTILKASTIMRPPSSPRLPKGKI